MGWTSGGVVKETRTQVCHIKNSQESVELYSLRGLLFELQNPSKCLKGNRYVAWWQHTNQTWFCSFKQADHMLFTGHSRKLAFKHITDEKCLVLLTPSMTTGTI